MSCDETIAAIATSYGVGSISIVRVSGDKALDIAKEISKQNDFTPRLATLVKIYSKNTLIDEALVIYFKNPYSFTGEDIVEFQCHGGVALSSMILDEVIRLGARLANPGEFSKRAFLNGKIDLTKANAIAKMIEAKSEDSVKALAKHLNGDLKVFVDEIREKLVLMLAYVEVSIDYAEDDLPKNIFTQINKQLLDITETLTKSVKLSKQKEGLINGFKVAIVGKPNVGKSSILNAILSQKRAIVSDIQGTTRDTIEEDIKLGTHLVRFVDTAGIREASDEIEQIGIKRSKKAIDEAGIILAIFDISNELVKEDKEIIKLIKEAKDKKIWIVLNKNDKPVNLDQSEFENFNVLKVSSKENVDEITTNLKNYFDTQSEINELIFSSKQQIDSVEKSLENLINAKDLLSENDLELFAFHINEAIFYIATITKGFDRDEILDDMFSNFCLGK